MTRHGNMSVKTQYESKKKKRFAIEKEFAETTSFNGIYFWANSKSSAQRIFWIGLILVFLGAMLHQIIARVSAYYEYNANTEISRSFVSGIEFPAVTICNFNRFFDAESDDELVAMQELNRISSPGTMAYATASNISVNHKKLGFYRDYTNFSFTEYLTYKGWQFRDKLELVFCSFQSTSCSAASFTPVVTQFGLCHTFNADVNVTRTQQVAGTDGGLFVLINANNYNYTEEPVFGRSEAGVLFQVHDKHQPTNMKQYGIAVPVGTKGYAKMSRRDTQLMYKPWGRCDPKREKTLNYFSKYSMAACMTECHTQDLIAFCGCRTFDQYWAAGVAPECSMEKMASCSSIRLHQAQITLTPDACGCTIPCSFTEYPIRMSYSHFPNRPTEKHYAKDWHVVPKIEYINQNVLGIDISFEEIGYIKEYQSKLIDESSLASDIGGQLGLWIGISFVTLVELLQYLFFRIKSVYCGIKQINKRRRSDIHGEAKCENESETWEKTGHLT